MIKPAEAAIRSPRRWVSRSERAQSLRRARSHRRLHHQKSRTVCPGRDLRGEQRNMDGRDTSPDDAYVTGECLAA